MGFGTSPVFLLFLTFLALKLTNHIDWSWWWVTSPLWTGFLLAAILWAANFSDTNGGVKR